MGIVYFGTVMNTNALDEEYFVLLGLALHQAQVVEFGLYGLAAHLVQTEETKKDKRFANLTAKDFLSADPEKRKLRKATLGQLCQTFGHRLLLSGDLLETFVEQRNIIVHEFYREVRTPKGCNNISDPKKYLRDFIDTSQTLEKAILGICSMAMELIAKKHDRMDELPVIKNDERNREVYTTLAVTNIIEGLAKKLAEQSNK